MNNRHRILINAIAASLAAAFTAPAAQAVDVYLRAESFTKTLPGAAAPVTMWGYSSCNLDFTTCGTPSSPGPEIMVPVGDPSLTIHLKNMLTEGSSVMIPGQTKPMTPVTFTDTHVPPRTRIRAFDAEAAASGGTGDYTWDNLRPGTYLYQSASHVQLQVQMGLYGAMVHDAPAASCATSPCAYDGVPYTQAKTVVFSEIDPALHDPAPKAANLTVDGYRPSFFLLNGEPFVAGSTGDLVTTATGERVLLRLVNAGLQNRAPQLLGGYYQVVAEDGHPAPVSRLQYNTLLPAGKALDVVFQPDSAGSYTLYDRRLGLVNGRATNGGQLGHIIVVSP
jgi:FtsP/CotA-like multicopper oxidase with cupredoxin domain